MAVSLEHVRLIVDVLGKRAVGDFCRPCAEPHARAFGAHTTLFLQKRDHWRHSVFVDLGADCIFDSTDISREFNRGHLHAEAETEIRHIVFASELRRPDFSLDAALAKTAGN